MRGQALAMVSAAAVALMAAAPAPAAAQQPQYDTYAQQDPSCQQLRQNRMVAGGILGAIAGAVLGSNVSGHGAKSEGGALGAVAGAVAGGAIARSTAKCGTYSNSYNGPVGGPYADQGYQGQGDGGYGLDGGPNAPSAYQSGYNDRANNNPNCQYGEETLRDPDGRAYKQSVYMCRGDDGVWRPQN